MTEKTATKTIKELMNGDKPGVLNLVLEQLLAPDSPWRFMQPTASVWSEYDHLTLEDFKEDCEWDEKWYVRFNYGVNVCDPYKDEKVSSKDEAKAKSMEDAREFDESDSEWYEHFQANTPTRNYRDYAEVLVNVSHLRLKESEYGQK